MNPKYGATHFYLRRQLKAKFRQYCREHKTTMSKVIREMVCDLLGVVDDVGSYVDDGTSPRNKEVILNKQIWQIINGTN
jgi:hypothetical protein